MKEKEKEIKIDGKLDDWKDVRDIIFPDQKDGERDGNILLGNGASIAIWAKFNYPDLFEEAKKNKSLDEKDEKLFKALKSENNFEVVLSSLLEIRKSLIIAMKICNAYDQNQKKPIIKDFKKLIKEFKECYKKIKKALINTISDVHIPWKDLEDMKNQIRDKILNELKNYEYVFSTNYDLLVYWAIMENKAEFCDFFFNKDRSDKMPIDFDILEADRQNKSSEPYWKNKTKVLYLHGAIHLCKFSINITKKIIRDDSENLLDLFKKLLVGKLKNVTPLIITEGKFENKKHSIEQSDYLKYAYDEVFKKYEGPLVIFGHSLPKEQDQHLIDVIKDKEYPIAISIYPYEKADNKKELKDIQIEKNRYIKLLGKDKIHFFNSETYPLSKTILFSKK